MKNYPFLIKKSALFVVIILFYGSSIVSQNRVLFIGNSLLYFNQMPSDFKEMMAIENDSIEVERLTFPGYSLWAHLNRYEYSKKKPVDFTALGKYKNVGKTIDIVQYQRYKALGYDMDRIKKLYKYDGDIDTITKTTLQLTLEKHHYDYIIVQDHGSHLYNDNFLKYIGAKSLERLKQLLVDTGSEDAKLIYFTEYPNKKLYSKNFKEKSPRAIRLPYDTVTCYKIEPQDSIYLNEWNNMLFDSTRGAKTPLEDIRYYEQGVQKLAETTELEMSPTAQIFDLIKTKHPNWKMYRMAGHPSQITSFMFACVYYEMITGKPADQLDFHGKISKKKASIVKKEVHNYLTK